MTRNLSWPALTDPRSPLNAGRRMLTIRRSVGPGFLWSAICSGCPLWELSSLPYREFSLAVRLHRVEHVRGGLVVAA